MTMTERDANCEQRLPGHLSGRLDSFREIAKREQSNDSDVSEEAYEEHYEYPLAVTVQRVVRVDLSTGGPADWLEAFLGDDGEIVRIVYHFADWFDHASTELDGPDYDAAEEFLRTFVETL